MEKKIAFFDIDGTLLHIPSGVMGPSEETKRVLKEFQKQGNYVVIATSRGSLPDSVQELNPDGRVCLDGHYIEFNNEVLLHDLFNETDVQLVLDAAKKHNGSCIVCGAEGNWYDNKTCPLIKKHREMYFGGYTLPTDEEQDRLKDTIHVDSITALFNTADDIHAAIKELPHNWSVNA